MYIADEYPAKTYLNDRYVTYTTHHSRQTISELPDAARENIVTITLAVSRPYRNSFQVIVISIIIVSIGVACAYNCAHFWRAKGAKHSPREVRWFNPDFTFLKLRLCTGEGS